MGPGGSNSLAEAEIIELRDSCYSPMIFSTRILLKLYTKEELIGHNVSGKTYAKSPSKNKQALDEDRMNFIKQLVEKYYINGRELNTGSKKNMDDIWMSCRKAINRVIRNFEIKESKLIKSIEADEEPVEPVHVGVKTRKYKLMILDDHNGTKNINNKI
jgi:hypothetical protein